MIRLRRIRRDGEDGFALIFVLMVTTVVMLGVAGVLAVVTPNITNSRGAQDRTAALAAAQSGVDDLISYLVSIPSCRSETKICPQALGATSTTLTGTRQRPSLGNGQTFTWTTASSATSDGYVRVTSTGSSNGVSRKIVADLSLQPSILAYGYYSDYESLSPQFLDDYYNPRSIYVSDSGTYGSVSSTYRGSSSVPKTVVWKGTAQSGTTAKCGQHWYYESAALPGRGNGSTNNTWYENGTVNSTSVTRSDNCDLVFSSSMVEDGLTFSRDAILSSGTGPKFNKAVYTMWGYNDGSKSYTTPAPTAGKYYRGDTMTNSPNLPAVAAADLVLPTSVGKDGIAENSCVYTGPTRVKLNGDGTATVTSPETTQKNAASDSACYPTVVGSSGIVDFKLNYATAGSGTVIVNHAGTVPSAGWASNPTKSTQTPAASNEVFYFPLTAGSDVPQHSDTSVSTDKCSTTAKYAATVGASCAWTNVASAGDGGGSTTGWSTYSAKKCSTTSAGTERSLFECEYGPQSTSYTPTGDVSGGQYKTVRTNIQAELAKGSCLTGTAAAQADCIEAMTNAQLAAANTGKHAYNYSSPSNNDHRYLATSTDNSPTTSTVATGTVTDSSQADDFFSRTAATPGKETVTQTPITTTVVRQTYSTTKKAWTTTNAAFTFTTTQNDYTYTAPSGGGRYFPDPNDVTEYATGTDASGNAVGSTGANQPGDLYVDGANKGKLSLVAENDVVVTGDITDPSGYTATSDAVSIVAGKNVRNYHPVKCADQTATDIANTTPGWCPNDITGLYSGSLVTNSGYSSAHPAEQYVNLKATGDRTIEAAIFALTGSLRTDNYNRGDAVGNLIVHGGIYQSHRGGNGVVSGSTGLSGTTLQYTYVDLQRAELPYVPPATSGNYMRPWNVVSISAGS
ncbi:hypothetical protein SAMN05443575_4200 [Jatrophihabitans endophyticus]|uniref:Uncharacterized protein n=1 Tax=Jatrophihabitans endophyticus TaxID=1206085 RepID=A0A1M5UF70_9ACTN|nr:hypothetical protein [Jatrophihabitans endophyticus]SHH61684.1 hypothetical protein SAMN05443575_4200 [Jatrophihabitans endophyticus]